MIDSASINSTARFLWRGPTVFSPSSCRVTTKAPGYPYHSLGLDNSLHGPTDAIIWQDQSQVTWAGKRVFNTTGSHSIPHLPYAPHLELHPLSPVQILRISMAHFNDTNSSCCSTPASCDFDPFPTQATTPEYVDVGGQQDYMGGPRGGLRSEASFREHVHYPFKGRDLTRIFCRVHVFGNVLRRSDPVLRPVAPPTLLVHG